MNYLTLPGVPNPLSRIGLGCMRLSIEREAESFALLDAYLERGGNVFDTAEIYGGGDSERALGEYIQRRGCRARAVIVTKGCVEPCLVRPEYIRRAIRESLERLKLDVIDVYLLHRDDPSVPASELLDVLNEAASAGLIRAFGGSNWSVSRLCEINRLASERGLQAFTVSSPHLALVTPREPWWSGCSHASQQDLDWYAKQPMVLLGWSPRARGFLGDADVTDPEHLADLIRVYYSPSNLEKRRRLRELAQKRKVSPAQMAVAYVLGISQRTVALVGPLSHDDLQRTMDVDQIGLDGSEIRWLSLEDSAA